MDDAEGEPSVPDQAAVPDLLIGLEFGHYRILERIGSGGMGVVYRGYDAHLERDVAIKVLPPGTIADDRARKRFRNEARALSKLNHPNIATVFDFHSDHGRDFLVMEFIEGVTLSQKLLGGSLPEKDAIDLATQLVEGLSAAHEQGVVHRDLKPGNLRITTDGRLKILDFGLAKLMMPSQQRSASDTVSETQTMSGTLAYMAPEQLLGGEVDARTDIHAVGIVLYEAATGLRPFAASDRLELMNQAIRSSPELPNTLNPRLSLEFVRIICKCLEREPENRYQSAKELAIDLRRLKSGGPSGSGMLLSAKENARVAKVLKLSALGVGFTVLFLLTLNIGKWRERIVGKAATPHIESLAVLPLVNLSGDPQQEYFADGMTEELINNLGRIAALRVISRTSVMRYKESKMALPAIAADLNVDAVIEGSVLRSGSRIRITAQLIDGKSDRNLWGSSYERNASDVLDLQAEVAQAIVKQVQAQLTPQEHRLIANARLVNPAAQEAYLLGRYHWNKTTEDEWRQARQYFEKAVEIDPTYAPPYAGLADYYTIDYELPTQTAFEKAKSYAQRALKLDETLAEAHLSLGNIRYNQWDWAGAEQEFKRTIELNPNYAEAHRSYAIYLSALGRGQEASDEIHIAQQLDPLSIQVSVTTGWIAYFARQYDRSVDQCKKTQKMDSNYVSAYDCLGSSYVAKGMYHQAIDTCQAAMTLSGGDPDRFVCLGQAYAAAGETAKARQLLRELSEISHRRHVPPYFFAVLHSALKESDEAFAWLEKGYDQRDPYLVWIKVSPAADGLRSDPRLADLIRRLGLLP